MIKWFVGLFIVLYGSRSLKSNANRKTALYMYSGITNNIYWGLRHGQSTANVEGIISSSLLVGCSAHGLTELGRQQSSESGSEVYEKIGLNSLKNTFIYSSPFLRAKQTAEKCIEQLQICQNLQSNNVKINRLSYNIRIQLRERDFGDLDGKPLHLYNDVWPRDAKSADNKSYGVESVNEVAYRCNEFIREMESSHSNANIIVVSHADSLQIFQTYLCGVDIRTFYQYRFKNGELRNMADLPAPSPQIQDSRTGNEIYSK